MQLIKLYTKRKYYVYYPLVFYWLMLFIGTTIPGKSLPSFGGSDKIKHLLGYFGLSILLNITFIVQQKYDWLRKYSILCTTLCAGFYGIIDELHQSFIPGRSCDIFDWIADVIGALISVIVVKYFVLPVFENQKNILNGQEQH